MMRDKKIFSFELECAAGFNVELFHPPLSFRPAQLERVRILIALAQIRK